MEADAFQQVFDLLPEPAVLLSISGSVAAANPSYCRLVGYAGDAQLRGVALRDLVADSEDRLERYLRICKRSRELSPGALTCKTTSGLEVPCKVEGALIAPATATSSGSVLLRFTPKESAQGKFLVLNTRIEALNREILERQRTQAKLRAEREWLRTTLASIGDAVIATDEHGRVSFMNAVAESLTGWTQADASGQSLDVVFDIINEETRQPVANPVATVLTQRTIVGLANHTVLIAKDGTERPIADSGAPILDESGNILGVVLVFRDVTDAHRAQTRLTQSEKRYRRIFETAHVAILEQDFSDAAADLLALLPNADTAEMDAAFAERILRQVHTVDVNAAAVDLFQANDKTELLGSLSRIFTPEAYTAFAQAFVAYAQGRTTFQSEAPLISFGGKPLQVLFAIGFPPDSPGLSSVLITFMDISDRKHAEEAVRRANAALVCANKDLEHFAYAAAHDLQEPLRNIVLYTQVLHRRYGDVLDAAGREACQVSSDSARRMQSLLEGLLAYTRVVSDSQVEADIAARSALDCAQIIASVRENLRTAIQEANANIVCDKLPLVNARDTHLLQLFQNLLSNAIKYKKPGEDPVIHITAKQEEGAWIFMVKDNGVGIRPEYRQKIFEAFKRLHGREIPGVGMGLTICSRIVAHYGGKIWVESEEGLGSTFAFTLPQQK